MTHRILYRLDTAAHWLARYQLITPGLFLTICDRYERTFK